MDLLEEMVVNKDFLARSDVYNISRGGVNSCMYGETNPFYGKRHTDEVKQKISSTHAGVHISETHKKNISLGLKRLYQEHPEITIKFASLKNKKQCRNKETGEIKFFKVSEIPENFEIYRFPQKDRHVSEERKLEIKRNRKERASRSKWYNNGIDEIFCFPENVPENYQLGRLPTLNVGRKYSAETIEKMRKAKLGKPASNKGKIFITNGLENKYISINEPIPEGWHRGMTRKH